MTLKEMLKMWMDQPVHLQLNTGKAVEVLKTFVASERQTFTAEELTMISLGMMWIAGLMQQYGIPEDIDEFIWTMEKGDT
jgi:hypothetical protein